jgi:hypothetical protein
MPGRVLYPPTWRNELIAPQGKANKIKKSGISHQMLKKICTTYLSVRQISFSASSML